MRERARGRARARAHTRLDVRVLDRLAVGERGKEAPGGARARAGQAGGEERKPVQQVKLVKWSN